MRKNRWGTIFLVVSALGFLFVRFQPWFSLEISFSPPFLSLRNLLLAFFGAALVGSLADWFAVSALFRHPLGLRLPHTNIIAQSKDTIASALPAFLLSFVTMEKIKNQLKQVDFTTKLVEGVKNSSFRRLVKSLLSEQLKNVSAFLQSSQGTKLLDVLFNILQKKVLVPETLANVIQKICVTGLDQRFLQAAASFMHKELNSNRLIFVERLTIFLKKNAGWQRLFVGKETSEKVLYGVLQELQELIDHPTHWLRDLFHSSLQSYANELRQDSAVRKQWSLAVETFLSYQDLRKEIQQWGNQFLTKFIVQEELWASAEDLIDHLTEYLLHNPSLCQKINHIGVEIFTDIVEKAQIIEKIVQYLSRLLQETPSQDFASKIEIAVWNDLQYIRVNGAVVGGLAGLFLELISSLLNFVSSY